MDSIRRGWLLLAAGGLLSWLSTFFFSGSEQLLATGQFVAPGIVITASLVAIGMLLVDNPTNLFTPIGPCAAMTLLYFGFGALVPAIADFPTLEFTKEFYPFSIEEVVAVHRISGLGLACLSFTAFLVLAGQAPRALVIGEDVDARLLRRSVVILYSVGMVVAVTLMLPSAIGLISYTVPMAISQLGRLATLSMLLMGFGLSRKLLPSLIFRPMYLVGIVVLLGGAVLTLSKLEIFIQAAGAFGGFVLGNPSRRTIGIAVTIAAVSFVVLTPLILAARNLDALGDNTLSGRFESGRATLELGAEILDTQDLPNIPMARVQYVNSMAWGRNEYNNGRPGNSVTQNVLWIFIPRAIWPDKPNLTGTGKSITMLAYSYDAETSTGITLFGEAYWNAGYVGVVVVSVLVGALLGIFSILSFNALTRMDIAGMIWVWGGALMGMRIDGFFITDYVGQTVILSLTYLLLKLILTTTADSENVFDPAKQNPVMLSPQ